MRREWRAGFLRRRRRVDGHSEGEEFANTFCVVRAGALRGLRAGRAGAAVYGAAAGDAGSAGAGWRSAVAVVCYLRREEWTAAFGSRGGRKRRGGIFCD